MMKSTGELSTNATNAGKNFIFISVIVKFFAGDQRLLCLPLINGRHCHLNDGSVHCWGGLEVIVQRDTDSFPLEKRARIKRMKPSSVKTSGKMREVLPAHDCQFKMRCTY